MILKIKNIFLCYSKNFILILFLFYKLILNSYAQASPPKEINLIIDRLKHDILTDSSFLKSMNSSFRSDLLDNGSWSDIDYKDKSGNWKPYVHLKRLLFICIMIEGRNQSYVTSNQLNYEVINKCLDYWRIQKPHANDWWANQIGVQQYLEKIIILSNKNLTDINRDFILSTLSDINNTSKVFLEGQNGVWFAYQQFIKALIQNSPNKLYNAVQFISDKLLFTNNEGLQFDYSFHQHGNQIYNGAYGVSFLKDMVFCKNGQWHLICFFQI